MEVAEQVKIEQAAYSRLRSLIVDKIDAAAARSGGTRKQGC